MPEPNDWFALLLRMPDVMARNDQEVLGDEEWAVTLSAIEAAVASLVDFRKQEGEALSRKFEEKLDNIARLMSDIEPYEKSRVEKIRTRIVEGLSAIPEVDYDKNRLEQKLIP